MIKLIRFLKPYKKEVILGPAFKLIEAIFELIIPLVMANIIDISISTENHGYSPDNEFFILKNGIFMILLYIFGFGFTLICQYYASCASQGVGTDLRNALFKKINDLPSPVLDKFGSSSLTNRITADVNQLQLSVAMLIRLVVRAPFLIIGSIIMSMLLDFKLSMVFLITAPCIFFVVFLIMKLSVPIYKKIQKSSDKIANIAKENILGIRVIRAFSSQKREINRFQNENSNVTDLSIKVNKLSAFLNPATSLILNIAILAIIWFGGLRVNSGALTTGQIIAFINYITQISIALLVFLNLFVIFTKAAASAERVNEILEIKDSENNDETIFHPISQYEISQSNISSIQFKNVYFSYNKRGFSIDENAENDGRTVNPDSIENPGRTDNAGRAMNALENISFSIKKGETIGIIGSTGSGKSSIANLLLKFYDKSKGEILINGIEIEKINRSFLREKISLVPQQSSLLSGSVRENLLIAKSDATDFEIINALKQAKAYDFVFAFENNLDFIIDQKGKNLSGGQKQRLSIARGFLKTSDLLILDDASSALDFATDSALRQEIKNMKSDKMIIIISQRVRNIIDSDKILVMDDGKIISIGTHEFLIENCDIYKEIWLCQKNPSDKNPSDI